jgi:eukaryotic-like serine/threonine-protein kinase
MNHEQWARVEDLYHAALDRPAGERSAYLRDSGADETILREVESLLAFGPEDSPLDAPAWERELVAGRRIGPYEILSRIGAGGMGEVWKARDTRLGREVAIKVSATRFSGRFQREARTIAALNHPHICTLYDVGPDCLVMEYVDGGSIEGPLPWQRVLVLGSQIADALSAAHAKGIVHRDLKPGNILLSGDTGRPAVKLLDFGIARVLATASFVVTQTIEQGPVGTLQYMSPEQLRAEPADARSDLFSLGCVLYEWICGRRAFAGSNTAAVTAAILKEDPPVLPSRLAPQPLARAIGKCLAKNPEDRWQSAAELRDELQRIASVSEPVKAAPFPKWVWAAVAAVVALAVLWLVPRPDSGPSAKLTVLTTLPGSERAPRLSPDGRQVAFSWDGEKGENAHIYVKLIGEANVLRLTDDPAPDEYPVWSPDGKRIAFRRTGPDGGIFAVSALGGAAQKLLGYDAAIPTAQPRNFGARTPSQISWSPDGKWLAMTGVQEPHAIVLYPVEGGDPRRITNPRAPEFELAPEFSPDGRELAFIRCAGAQACDVYVQDLGSDASPRGAPRRVTGQHMAMTGLSWGPGRAFLVYSASPHVVGLPFLWRTRMDSRAPERLDIAGMAAVAPSMSPAGGRLVFQRNLEDVDIWRYRAGGVKEPFIVSSLTESNPQYSPDGTRIAFSSNRGGEAMEIWVANADGSNPRPVTSGPERFCGSPRWSPDSKWIACDSQDDSGQWDIYVVEASGGRPRRLTLEPSNEVSPSWSRDGQWIYFGSNRTGTQQIWRMPAVGGTAEQVTTEGGYTAFESADGATLFYVKTGLESALYAKPLAGGAERQLVAHVASRAFLPFADGIYYFGREERQEKNALRFLRFSTGSSELILDLPSVQIGLAVSPDRSTFAFGVTNRGGSDLMMIENFR